MTGRQTAVEALGYLSALDTLRSKQVREPLTHPLNMLNNTCRSITTQQQEPISPGVKPFRRYIETKEGRGRNPHKLRLLFLLLRMR